MSKSKFSFIEKISPIILKTEEDSLKISISHRFFLFNIMKKIINRIEEDPYLNFIAILKNYKVFGKLLHGTLHEFYRDRNTMYFKNFFYDITLYKIVKEDIESLYPDYKNILVTITKRGVIIYDNYKKWGFNVLLLTIHSGIWMPKDIQRKQVLTDTQRFREEDVYTDKIYRNLVLKNAGIWIDNKQSRYAIDFNRKIENAIYSNNSESWVNDVWRDELTLKERNEIYASYKEFYFILSKLVDTYQFNIIFDAHSMNDIGNRPNISFGTEYIPKFYMPVVKSMQKKMQSLGYSPVLLNVPYKGGFILRWLNQFFPNRFIFSMEVNKKLYMQKNNINPIRSKLSKLQKDLYNIVNIDLEEEK